MFNNIDTSLAWTIQGLAMNQGSLVANPIPPTTRWFRVSWILLMTLYFVMTPWHSVLMAKEQCVLDTHAGKQQSLAATDIYLTIALKKWKTFKYILELWLPNVSKEE